MKTLRSLASNVQENKSHAVKRTYMPLSVMMEPTGFGFRFSAFFKWLYFRNPNYMNSDSTFTRICGWQSITQNSKFKRNHF
jgi:hypothetical protein